MISIRTLSSCLLILVSSILVSYDVTMNSRFFLHVLLVSVIVYQVFDGVKVPR
jgi:hypothetical protein